MVKHLALTLSICEKKNHVQQNAADTIVISAAAFMPLNDGNKQGLMFLMFLLHESLESLNVNSVTEIVYLHCSPHSSAALTVSMDVTSAAAAAAKKKKTFQLTP